VGRFAQHQGLRLTWYREYWNVKQWYFYQQQCETLVFLPTALLSL